MEILPTKPVISQFSDSPLFRKLPAGGLTREDAAEYSKRIQKNPKDRGAINAMVLMSLRESLLYMRELSNRKLGDGELVSLAYKALERSARSFQADRGHRFFHFAKKALRGVLIEHWRSLETVRRSKSVNWEEELSNTSGENRHPDLLDPETTSSLEGSTEPDFSSINLREDLEEVERAMKCLNQFERAIVKFITTTGFTFRECAEEFGCSRAWVGLTYNRAVVKLRNRIADTRKRSDCLK